MYKYQLTWTGTDVVFVSFSTESVVRPVTRTRPPAAGTTKPPSATTTGAGPQSTAGPGPGKDDRINL